MTRRRTFLRTTGVAALGGLTSIAGCLGVGGSSSETSTTSTSTTTSTTGNESGGNETTTTQDEKERNPGERFHLGGTTSFDDFENLSEWSADSGAIEADTETAFQGSQSMRVTAPRTDDFAWVSKSGDWDLSGKTLSLAISPKKPVDNVIVEVRLIAPDTNNIRTMGELLRVRGQQTWMRLDLATRTFSGNPDLSSVKRIELGMRAASGSIDFNVDDLRTVPRPETGNIVLSFDDSLESHFTEGFKKMQEHEMPGNVGVITDQVGTDNSLSVDEMEEMKNADWEFASHGTTDEALTKMSTQKMWLSVNDANDWLVTNGFSKGEESFVYPHGEFNDEIVNTIRQRHTLGFRYMDPLSAASGKLTDPLTVGRGNAAYDLTLSKTMVTYAEQFNTNTVLTFHDIAENGGLSISPANFSELIDYIANRDVNVITFSELKQNQLAD